MKNKKEQITETAIKLFAQEGAGVATARIAKEANVSNGTLFNYFETKNKLINSTYLSIKREIADNILTDVDFNETPRKVLQYVWTTYILWALKNEDKVKAIDVLYFSQELSSEVAEQGNDLFKQIYKTLQKAVEQEELENISIPLMTEIMSAQMKVTLNFIKHNNIKNSAQKDLIDQNFKIIWCGLKKQG